MLLCHVKLYVITSDFHMERSKLLFEHFFRNTNCSISMISSKTLVNKEEYNELIENEKIIIKKIKKFL